MKKTMNVIWNIIKLSLLIVFIILSFLQVKHVINNPEITEVNKWRPVIALILSFYPVLITMTKNISFVKKFIHVLKTKNKSFEFTIKYRIYYNEIRELKDFRFYLIKLFEKYGYTVKKALYTTGSNLINFSLYKPNEIPENFDIFNDEENNFFEIEFNNYYVNMKKIHSKLVNIGQISSIIKESVSIDKERIFLSMKYEENDNPYIKHYTDYSKGNDIQIYVSKNTLMNNDIIEISAISMEEALIEVKNTLFNIW